MKLDPEAVELVDRTMIDLGRSIPIFRNTIDRMLLGQPDSLLIVEFHGFEDAPLLAKLADLDTLMGDLGLPGQVVRATDAAFQADIESRIRDLEEERFYVAVRRSYWAAPAASPACARPA